MAVGKLIQLTRYSKGRIVMKRKQYAKKKLVSKISSQAVGTKIAQLTGGVTLQKRVSLRYAQTMTFTIGTVGALGVQNAFRLNGLFDPDFTGIGHQPYMFDTWAQLYRKYRVDSVKVEILWTTLSGTADACCVSSFIPFLGGLALSGISVDRATELPQVSTVVLSSGGNSKSVKQTFDIKVSALEGMTQKDYEADETYQAIVTADPAKTPFLLISTGSYSGLGGQTLQAQVLITYNVLFWSTITQAQS